MIPEATTSIQDQGMTNLLPEAHKVALTVMIDRNPKVPLDPHILPSALVVSVPYAQKMLKLVSK